MNMVSAKPGFFVQDRFLYSKDNEKVILRGINHMFIWTDREGKTIPEIAKTGANCVRIVWNTRGRVSDLDNIIVQCISNGMIPIPEIHDTTGNWERLMDYNDAICEKMCELLDIHPHITPSTPLAPSTPSSLHDFRAVINPKHPLPDADFLPRTYYQVYQQKHGFLSNLSVLDLLFNMGPESIFYL